MTNKLFRTLKITCLCMALTAALPIVSFADEQTAVNENKKVVNTFAEKSGGFDNEKTRNFIRDFSEKGFEPFDYSKIDNSLESNNNQLLWDNQELTPLNKKTDKNILFEDLNKNIESSALSQASKILNEISK